MSKYRIPRKLKKELKKLNDIQIFDKEYLQSIQQAIWMRGVHERANQFFSKVVKSKEEFIEVMKTSNSPEEAHQRLLEKEKQKQLLSDMMKDDEKLRLYE